MKKTIVCICIMLSFLTLVSVIATAQKYYLRGVMGSGGNVGLSGPDGSKINSVVGQTAIFTLVPSTGNEILHQGFWVTGGDTVVGIEDNRVSLSESLINYPNPFSNNTTIRYMLPGTGQVTIKIFDIVGNLRKTLINEIQSIGQQEIIWDGKDDNGFDCASGSYMYELNVAAYSATENGQFSDFNLRNVMVIVR